MFRKFSFLSFSVARSSGLNLYLGILKTSEMIFLLYIILEVHSFLFNYCNYLSYKFAFIFMLRWSFKIKVTKCAG